MKTLVLGACLLVGCSSSSLGTPSEGGAGAGPGPGFVNTCSAARAQLIGALESVSTGEVRVISQTAGVTRLYVNATAGGSGAAANSPWLFLSLSSVSKVELTDVSALESRAWDLAFKRAIVYSNAGDGGPGEGGALLLKKDFASVTSSDAQGAEFVNERFFDDECNPNVDVTGQVYTSFADWYAYDAETHVVSPGSGTWLVRGATGKLFKLEFESYYGTPSGGMGTASGAYLLRIEAL